MTFNNEIQRNVFNAVTECLPFKIEPGNILVEDGPSYSWSPIKVHDYAVGVMAAYGSAWSILALYAAFRIKPLLLIGVLPGCS